MLRWNLYTHLEYVQCVGPTEGVHNFSINLKGHLKILGARRVTWSKLCTEGPQILGLTVENFGARASWSPGFMQPLGIQYQKLCSKSHRQCPLQIYFQVPCTSWNKYLFGLQR
jgi:hypothetical protein